MGNLISIYSIAKEKTVKNKLEQYFDSKNSSFFYLNDNWLPKNTNSPYVSAIFDVNYRFEQQKIIREKLKQFDYVIVNGYTSSTMVNLIDRFNSDSAKKAFCIWLDSLEYITYEIQRPDIAILIEDENVNIKKLADLFPRDFNLIKLSEIETFINNYIKPESDKNIQKSKLFKSTLINLLDNLDITDLRYEIVSTSTNLKDTRIKELLATRSLIAKREPQAYYYQSIVTPLCTEIIANKKINNSFNNTLIKFFENLDNPYTEIENNKYTFDPNNEIRLAENIAWRYGTGSAKLNYTETMRLIETWLLNLNPKDSKYINLKVTCYLSYHDLLVISKLLPGINFEIPVPSPRYGFVDTSKAPNSIVDVVDQTFDNSTLYSTETSKYEYLLLGHITPVNINLNTTDIIKIIKSKDHHGSEKLDELINELKSKIQETYPIIYETALA